MSRRAVVAALVALIIFTAALVAACGGSSSSNSAKPEVAGGVSVPKANVKFGNAPFVDHTDSILATERGWFADVGIQIEPQPSGAIYSSEQMAAALLTGKVDVQSSNYQILQPALAHTKELRCFAYGDFFIGFALMGQKKFKTYGEFVAQGDSPKQAVQAAAAQMEGNTLTWSADGAVRNFGRTILQQTGVPLTKIKSITVEDPEGVQLMQSNRADFQIGGAPSRETLQQAGYKPIITASDLTGIVKPPYRSSTALAAVSTNGWCTTEKYWKADHDTLLRMASVKWRIDQLIAEHPAETAATQVKFVNQTAGTTLNASGVEFIYKNIDPYITFAEQKKLWFTPGQPTYEPTMIEASLKQAVETHTLARAEAVPSDLTIAPEVYGEALKLKAESEKMLAAVKAKIGSLESGKKKLVETLITNANRYYRYFDFLDSQRFASAAAKEAGT